MKPLLGYRIPLENTRPLGGNKATLHIILERAALVEVNPSEICLQFGSRTLALARDLSSLSPTLPALPCCLYTRCLNEEKNSIPDFHMYSIVFTIHLASKFRDITILDLQFNPSESHDQLSNVLGRSSGSQDTFSQIKVKEKNLTHPQTSQTYPKTRPLKIDLDPQDLRNQEAHGRI